VEAACATTVHTREAFAREVVVAQESVTALVRDARDWATLADREAWERVSRVEAESATALASANGEA
jgi:hypothetical protein